MQKYPLKTIFPGWQHDVLGRDVMLLLNKYHRSVCIDCEPISKQNSNSIPLIGEFSALVTGCCYKLEYIEPLLRNTDIVTVKVGRA